MEAHDEFFNRQIKLWGNDVQNSLQNSTSSTISSFRQLNIFTEKFYKVLAFSKADLKSMEFPTFYILNNISLVFED